MAGAARFREGYPVVSFILTLIPPATFLYFYLKYPETLPAMAFIHSFLLSILIGFLIHVRLRSKSKIAEANSHYHAAADRIVRNDRLALIGEMLAGVIHELNNPLTSVRGFSDLMKETQSVGELKDYAAVISKEAARCQRIAANLLNFSRRKSQSVDQVYSANELLRDVIDLKSYNFRNHKIEIVLILDPLQPRFKGDPYEMQQVFLNLINNAEQSMEGQKEARVLNVRTLVSRGRFGIEIQDSGPGAAPEILDKIFEPFFTTKPEGRGTGLGLGISRDIVTRHGGTLSFSNIRGRGACVRIELPLAGALKQEEERVDMNPSSKKPFEGVRVVVVDDEPHLVSFYETALKRMGCEVRGFLSVRKAREYLASEDFDAMIIDCRMVGEDSKDIFEFVRVRKPHLSRRIIFSSGDTYDAEMIETIEKNGNLFLPKPCGLTDITTTLGKALKL